MNIDLPVFVQTLISISAAIAVFTYILKSQNSIKDKLDMLDKEVLSKDETEKLIKLYTDPLKDDLRVTRSGIEKLMMQFHSLELMIARELGSLDGAFKIQHDTSRN